ncbi:MAG TPA: alpha/beta family hydrolase [Solirubrobacteraceae bacterium]
MADIATEILIPTTRGPARAHLTLPPATLPRAALVLGHGAGGGIGASDLQTARRAALSAGVAVALIEQPYRVAGRRSAAPAAQLDEAWVTVVEHLRAVELEGVPLITGGRSSGARVACRTAAVTGAVAVLCLAFPLLPPTRAGAPRPAASRLSELDAVTVPTLVIQGVRDRFGMPPEARGRSVVAIAGDHALKSDATALGQAVTRWLEAVLEPSARTSGSRSSRSGR